MVFIDSKVQMCQSKKQAVGFRSRKPTFLEPKEHQFERRTLRGGYFGSSFAKLA